MKGKIIVVEGTDCSGKETQSKMLEERIIIEGTDGSGKETQAKLLIDKLNKENIKAVYETFPMYDTPTGRIVGGAYLGKPEMSEGFFPEGAPNVDPRVSCLYYAADRKYNIGKALEYLDKGYYVIRCKKK